MDSSLSAIWVMGAALFGLVIGSFLNVVIYRVPRGESLLGRSHCPGCGKQIAAYDNIPLISWLLLRGKCRACSTGISVQYPLVEAATGVLFYLVAARFGMNIMSVTLLVFAAISVTLFMIDIQTLRLPNRIVYPTFILMAVGVSASAWWANDWDMWVAAAACAVCLGLFYFSIWVLTLGKGMGLGDVKLAPSLGLVMGSYGVGAAVVGTAAAWLAGAMVGMAMMASGQLKRGTPIPFGPFLLVGTWGGIFFGESVTAWYLATTGMSL